jgi:cyclophilin family peptidyl-prolyl cis-trans isomerase
MTKNYRSLVDDFAKDFDFKAKKYAIEVETNQGSFTLDLFTDLAPGHCKNILGLAKAGFYDGLKFHRVISGFMIQGGCPSGTGTGGPGFNIDAEFNATPHKAGILSMARAQNPNSAGSQFFVCVADALFLDKQYTAFGKTRDEKSLEVVKSIGKVATDSGDAPLEDVVMTRVTVLETSQ